MRNIRKCVEEDRLFVISSRIDSFIGDKDFYDIPNDVLLAKKREIEQDVKEKFGDYKILVDDGESIGSFAVYPYEDGNIVDSISIKSEASTLEAKEFIMKYSISMNYGIIYTFVSTNAEKDLNLYKSLGFVEVETKDGMTKLKLNNF